MEEDIIPDNYHGCAANEKGVILTGTITGATKEEVLKKDPFDPVVSNDVGEPNLPDYMIGNAASAREAVVLLAKAIAERVHDGSEIYMAADSNEAWYVEVYTGHHWAAVKMPEHMRGTVWSCLGNCEHGVFHPINASQNYLPAAYTNDAQRTFGYDPNRAADAFRRLSALAQSNRKWYGSGVRAYWRANEMRRAVEWPEVLSAVIKVGDCSGFWDYTRAEEEKALVAAKKLYDELLWYAAANNRITGDGSGATDVPLEPFKPSDDLIAGRDLR